MAVLKEIVHRKNAEGYDEVHFKSSSDIIFRPSGRTVEQDLADYLPQTQATDDVPEILTTGKLVTTNNRVYANINGNVTGLYKLTDSLNADTLDNKHASEFLLRTEYTPVDLSAYLKSADAANLYATKNHNHSGVYAPAVHTHARSQITDFPSSMPASDVYSWAKQPSKPSYSYNEVGAAAASHTHPVSQITGLPAFDDSVLIGNGSLFESNNNNNNNYKDCNVSVPQCDYVVINILDENYIKPFDNTFKIKSGGSATIPCVYYDNPDYKVGFVYTTFNGNTISFTLRPNYSVKAVVECYAGTSLLYTTSASFPEDTTETKTLSVTPSYIKCVPLYTINNKYRTVKPIIVKNGYSSSLPVNYLRSGTYHLNNANIALSGNIVTLSSNNPTLYGNIVDGTFIIECYK